MNVNDEPGPPEFRPRKFSILLGVTGLMVIAGVGIAALLFGGAGLVWGTSAFEGWLDLPQNSVLLAVVGISIIVILLIAQARIINAIADMQWNILAMYREEFEDDEDDENNTPKVKRGRRS